MSLLCLHNSSIALIYNQNRTYIKRRRKLTMEEFSLHYKGFPVLFSALRASPLPPHSTTSTLASYCSAMHNTSGQLWKAFLRRKWHHWRNRLWREQHQRGQNALGCCPRPWLQHQTAEMTVVWTAWCKLGHCENNWNVKMPRVIQKHSQISALPFQHFLNCGSCTFYVSGSQRRWIFYILLFSEVVGPAVSLSCITNQILPPIPFILIWCSDACFGLTVLTCYAIQDHIGLNHLTSDGSGWHQMMTFP